MSDPDETIPCSDGTVLVPHVDGRGYTTWRPQEPTARHPYKVTLCWTPDQNSGRVSVFPSRSPVRAIWGRLAAGEDPDLVAADYGCTPIEVAVLDVLRADADGQDPGPDKVRAALAELVRLKKHKDEHGPTEDYLAAKGPAWARAEEALAECETCDPADGAAARYSAHNPGGGDE